jgi:uncharacterized protein
MFAGSPAPAFMWQGGEPTIVGLDFFKQALSLQKFYAKGKPFQNSIQTHGMLLDEDWADFLRDENFLVGVSLDGPKHIHDRYRKDHQGEGTFDRVIEKVDMLLAHKVPVNAMATVNDYSCRFPEEIYQFFMQRELIYMQFSPIVEIDSSDNSKAAPFSVSAEGYADFLVRLFKVWHDDFDLEQLKQKSSIRFFDSLLQKYIGMSPDLCALHKECNLYLVVEHNGDIFSCDFLVESGAQIGNLMETNLLQIYNSPAHAQLGRQKSAYDDECRRCQWLQSCYGGCIKDRLHDPADNGRNHFCASYKAFFPQVDEQLSELARLYKQHY